MTVTDSPTLVEVSIDEIKQDLLAYLQRVENGETLIIMKTGKPLAEIRPIAGGTQQTHQLRPFALCVGEFQVPDNFDDPLPEHIIRAFEG